MILISFLTAISLVLYIVGPKFALPFFPSFLEINFSMLPIFIGLFMLGIKGGLLIVGLRFLLKLPFSSTAYVGELADLILGLVTVIPSYILIKKVNCKGKTAIQFIGILLTWVVGGIISNLFSFPLYVEMFGGKEVIIPFLSMIPGVNESNYFIKYILFAVIPFNLLIGFIVLLLTFPVHNRLKNIYNMICEGEV